MNKTIIIAGLIFALQGCNADETTPIAPQAPMPSQASIASLKLMDVNAHYVSSGTVTSDHRVSISSRISGYIRSLSVREGDHVKKNQVLVRVDPINAQQALVQVQADLADAKADKQRYEALFRDHAASRQQLDRVRLRYKLARSQVAQARNQLGYAEVRSPVQGMVVEKRLSKGDLAQPGAAILSIEDPSSLLVNTYVSEQFVSAIHAGDSVDVDIPSLHRHITGIVRQVVEAADPVSHQFLVKIALHEHEGVHPGMYAQVGFAVASRQILIVPQVAIIERSGLHGVYLIDEKDIAHYRQVRLGEENNQGGVEILAGLHAGDRIAWSGNPVLQTGMMVQAK